VFDAQVALAIEKIQAQLAKLQSQQKPTAEGGLSRLRKRRSPIAVPMEEERMQQAAVLAEPASGPALEDGPEMDDRPSPAMLNAPRRGSLSSIASDRSGGDLSDSFFNDSQSSEAKEKFEVLSEELRKLKEQFAALSKREAGALGLVVLGFKCWF
jgi:hypothetical protein